MAAISTLRNIGPATEAALIKAGISSAEALREIGADAAYARMLGSGMRPHFIGYYVLHMALQGRPWNDCKGEEKKALRKAFDALCAGGFDSAKADLERILNQIGVIESARR